MSDDRSRHALITGGAGFIGSHLTERLLRDGYRVTIVDDLSTGRVANLANVIDHPEVRIEEGNVVDADLIARLAAPVGVIVHLAAAVGVQLIIEEPVRTIETNVRGTENVLKAALPNLTRVLVASTSEVYGKGTRYPFREDDDVVLGPTMTKRWAYAATKMVDEFLCLAYHDEYGLPVVPFRLFNTVGARQTGRYGMVIPRLVRQALSGAPLTVFGDGTQQRCFCDVRDVTDAVVGLVERTDAPVQVYNIGNTEEVSIAELADRIVSAAGSSSSIQLVPYDEAYPPGFEDMHRRIPDTTRIHSLLDWTPKHSLDDIIASVIEHERASVGTGDH
jgi:UDP-glucose 4-epimerase